MKSNHGTLNFRESGQVLFAEIDAPPLNLLGPELVGDFVDLIKELDKGDRYKVVVFSSAHPDFFISHVNTSKIKEYREAAAALTGEASIALLFRRLSRTKAVTIAQIEGRARGAGSEFAMSCDLRFGSKERAILGQMECAFGALPGGGGTQYLTRLMGRGRALEVLLSADDFNGDIAELYGWINRAIPQEQLATYVSNLAHRIARFPMHGLLEVKARVNMATLAPEDDFLHDSDAFLTGLQHSESQTVIERAVRKGFGVSEPFELRLGTLIAEE